VFKAHLILAGTGFQDDPLENIIAIIADISAKEQAQSEKMEKERLQGVLEMAGAICHEINQPLQSILGYASMVDAERNKSSGEIQQIALQVDRIGKITRRLSSITRYKTISYPGNKQIIDIWGSSSGDVDKLG
jgi:C4-dicarboxylate-specific signal transduction histidine kinase